MPRKRTLSSPAAKPAKKPAAAAKSKAKAKAEKPAVAPVEPVVPVEETPPVAPDPVEPAADADAPPVEDVPAGDAPPEDPPEEPVAPVLDAGAGECDGEGGCGCENGTTVRARVTAVYVRWPNPLWDAADPGAERKTLMADRGESRCLPADEFARLAAFDLVERV